MFTNQKYAVLPANLIKLFGEICGYNDLNDQLCQVLAEDATFRLNEVLNQSVNLKRKLNKQKLDVNEINLMLKSYNVKAIEGYESSDKNKIRSTLFDEKEKPINLVDKSDLILKRTQFVRLRSLRLSSEYVKLKYIDLVEPFDLPEESKNYYNFLIKNLFTTNDNLFEKLLKDLSSNDQLNNLIPYLINHFTHQINVSSDNQINLLKLILIVETLIKNKHLEFTLQNSFVQLVDLALDCLLNERNDDINFLFKFRFCSAKLLRSIMFKFHYVINRPLIKILDLLLNQFINSTHLDIKYGIIIFFQNLNPFIFFEILFPSIIRYVHELEIKSNNKTIEPNEKKMFSFILVSLVSCFNYVVNSDRILKSDEFDINQYYIQIYGIYGDSFTNLIASNDLNFIKIIQKKVDQ